VTAKTATPVSADIATSPSAAAVAVAEPLPPPVVPLAVAAPDKAPATTLAPEEVGLPSFLAEPVPQEHRSRRRLWLQLAAVFLLCAAGAGAVLKWGRLTRGSELGLETYDINGSFLIRWDRDSAAIRSSRHATLEIQDGGEKTPIELNGAELAAGGYGYIRRTGQVSVHMKVDGVTPTEEYSNFSAAQSLGSQQSPPGDGQSPLAQALAEKEHLKTELINESMQSQELRREVTDLRRQLDEARANKTEPPPP